MAREIKFRGKTDNGNWLVGEIISLNSHKYIAPNDGDWFDFIEWVPENVFHAPDSDKYEVEENTIGQYTGLHDKNGKEIYEGDIVHLDTWKPDAMQIAFIEGAFCLADANGHYLGDIHYIHHAEVEQCTVIGNIHDNPELLKED